jgi:hypothetical protein
VNPLQIVGAIQAVRDIIKFVIQMWGLLRDAQRASAIRKQEQENADKLKKAQTADEVERAARNTLGGI